MTELSPTARLDELLLMLGTPPNTAATPTDNPYHCSCRLTAVGLQLQPLWIIPITAAVGYNTCSQARRRGSTGPSKP